MRLRRLTGLAMVFLLLAAVPAAGTAEDPEISDRCGDLGTENDRRVVPGWADICAGWFETLSAPDDTPELRLTLRMAEDLDGRLPAAYGVWFQAGGCAYTAWHVDEQVHLPSESWLQVKCDPDEESECTLDEPVHVDCTRTGRSIGSPEVAVEFSGTDISWTMRFDGALADQSDAYEHGDVLHVTGAVAGARAREYVVASYGCSFGTDQPTRCQSIGGDLVLGGGEYVVGT
jgi:hypothetical protein